MFVRLIPYVFSCELLAITIAAWARLYQRRQGPQHALGLVAFGMVTANAVFVAATFLFYQFRPPSHLPPWQEPEILSLGFLFLLASACSDRHDSRHCGRCTRGFHVDDTRRGDRMVASVRGWSDGWCRGLTQHNCRSVAMELIDPAKGFGGKECSAIMPAQL
jgi:hypothetical protein